jgi:hypothetical protein
MPNQSLLVTTVKTFWLNHQEVSVNSLKEVPLKLKHEHKKKNDFITLISIAFFLLPIKNILNPNYSSKNIQ